MSTDSTRGSVTFGGMDTVRTRGLRSGIIGLGFIGEVHARAVTAAGGTLAAVAGSSAQGIGQRADQLGAASAMASAEQLIDSPDVDVVHICTPNDVHAELAKAALAAGKHVICEKPLATTLADAQDLAMLAEQAGLVAAVPFAYRYYPLVREVRERVRGDEINIISGSYLQDWMSLPEDTSWRVDPDRGGASRTFADIGVHWCDLVEFVTGHRIVAVTAQMKTALPNRDTEDAAALLFRTDAGAIGSAVVSQISQGRKNELRFLIDGAERSYAFQQESPDELWVGGRHTVEVLKRGVGQLGADATRLSVLPAGHPQGYQDCFNAFVADVYATAQGATFEGMPTFADGLRAAHLTDAVLRSEASGAWVEVPAPVSATR
ncbi:MAG: Gfo/Idh/MocA family protein [Beutenbergiaceae bacterium]